VHRRPLTATDVALGAIALAVREERVFRNGSWKASRSVRADWTGERIEALASAAVIPGADDETSAALTKSAGKSSRIALVR
jgi:hypothetical protein